MGMLVGASCSDAASTPGSTAPAATTVPVSPAPTAPVSTAEPDASVEACRLPNATDPNIGVGFPLSAQRLPSMGDVRSLVLFVDFADAPAQLTPQQMFANVSPEAERFQETVSYGRMHWTLEPHFVWLRLSQPSSVYGDGLGTYEGHTGFIQEAVTLADAEVDFSSVDSVVVLANPASDVGYGPAMVAGPGFGYTADGVTFANGVTSGADLTYWGSLWLNHETGHTLGLPDLYAFDGAGDEIHRFVGEFGVMGMISGRAPEHFAIERWQLGWLDDGQMVCVQEGTRDVELTAVESVGGTKAVMVPVGPTRLIVVESRRPIGYDSALGEPGALVYVVDSGVATGTGPIVVQPVADDPLRSDSPLAPGESITVEGVTITVVQATDGGDTVQVTVGG